MSTAGFSPRLAMEGVLSFLLAMEGALSFRLAMELVLSLTRKRPPGLDLNSGDPSATEGERSFSFGGSAGAVTDADLSLVLTLRTFPCALIKLPSGSSFASIFSSVPSFFLTKNILLKPSADGEREEVVGLDGVVGFTNAAVSFGG